jgi:hypothetical protein
MRRNPACASLRPGGCSVHRDGGNGSGAHDRAPSMSQSSCGTAMHTALQFLQRRRQASDVFVIGHDDNVTVATKLRRAVEHAGLSAHKQVPNPLGGKRRKDFVDRVRDQVSLPRANRIATAYLIRATFRAVSVDTIPSTNLHRLVLRVVVCSVLLASSWNCTLQGFSRAPCLYDASEKLRLYVRCRLVPFVGGSRCGLVPSCGLACRPTQVVGWSPDQPTVELPQATTGCWRCTSV